MPVDCEGEALDIPGRQRPMRRSVKEQLEDKIKGLEADLADAKNALDLLKKNPEVSTILEAIAKVRIRI
jgi:hypothetical protein